MYKRHLRTFVSARATLNPHELLDDDLAYIAAKFDVT
jgi:hypothetical protein